MTHCCYCESLIPRSEEPITVAYTSAQDERPACRDCVATPRIAYVGCGAAKRDEQAPAADLYTSSYFSLKRELAQKLCDEWFILSAKHGVLSPDEEIEPYDASLDPSSDSYIGDYEAGKWAVRTTRSIQTLNSFRAPHARYVVLAGEDYTHHITGAFEHETVSYPFRDTSGIGEQQSWLRETIDDYRPAGQAEIGSFQEGSP